MIIYVNEAGSDRQELVEELVKEGVTFKESSGKTTRESSTAGVADGGRGSQSA